MNKNIDTTNEFRIGQKVRTYTLPHLFGRVTGIAPEAVQVLWDGREPLCKGAAGTWEELYNVTPAE